MPELPEIEVVKKSLFKMVNKSKITSIKINNKNLRYKIPNNFSKNLAGEQILKISRKSKYLLFHFKLLGDMIINAYFFFMSIYGWFYWSYKREGQIINKVSYSSNKDYVIVALIFLISLILISIIYKLFNLFNSWSAYIDTLTTGIFFVAMWLMARRKVESWIFWIIGDIITVPLYGYRGLGMLSLQYMIFLILAIQGYYEWKKTLNKQNQTA